MERRVTGGCIPPATCCLIGASADQTQVRTDALPHAAHLRWSVALSPFTLSPREQKH